MFLSWFGGGGAVGGGRLADILAKEESEIGL